MNTDGKIYIIVTDKLPGGTEPGPAPKPPDQKKKTDEGMLMHWARSQLINTAKNIANTAVFYSLNNIGNFTGDYITQTHVSETIANVRSIISIGSAALAGFTATGGNPIGAAIGASLAVINETVGSVTRIHSARIQNSKINYEIEQLRERSGMNTLIDGSRGTEN